MFNFNFKTISWIYNHWFFLEASCTATTLHWISIQIVFSVCLFVARGMDGWVISCPQVTHKTLVYIYRTGLWLDIQFLQLQCDVANIKDNFFINTQYFMFSRTLDWQDGSYHHILFLSLHHHSHEVLSMSSTCMLTELGSEFFSSSLQ